MNPRYYLFLDDYRTPQMVTWKKLPAGPWLIVANYDEFVEMVEHSGLPDFIAYDHDLADMHYAAEEGVILEKTGEHCAEWMVEYCRKNGVAHPPYEVHSMNPIGAERIRNVIKDYMREYCANLEMK